MSIVICTWIVSFILFIYPFVDNCIYKAEQLKTIEEYDDFIEQAKTDNNTKKEKNKQPTKKNNNNQTQQDNKKIDFNKLKKDIINYNKNLYQRGQLLRYESSALNLSNYGFQNEMYGYISIEKIDLNMPIYFGATDYNMSLGAVHMGDTSIPYGGKNTNAVIAGHCGYGSRDYFRYIENLTEGDIVKITTPFGCLKYSVRERKIISPRNSEDIIISKGEDLLTLITCYPYPSNEKRCCVVCVRS